MVDAIVKSKTAKGEFINHPDAPEREDARLYMVYDTTEFEQITEMINETTLQGTADHLTAEDTQAVAAKMAAAKFQGPKALLALPSTKMNLVGKVAHKAKQPAKSKCGVPKPKAASAGRSLVVGFKLLQRLLCEIRRANTMFADFQAKPETSSFCSMVGGHIEALGLVYEELRNLLQEIPPREERLCRSC